MKLLTWKNIAALLALPVGGYLIYVGHFKSRTEPVALVKLTGDIWVTVAEFPTMLDYRTVMATRDLTEVRNFVVQVETLDDKSKAEALASNGLTPETYQRLKRNTARTKKPTDRPMGDSDTEACVPISDRLAQIGNFNAEHQAGFKN